MTDTISSADEADEKHEPDTVTTGASTSHTSRVLRGFVAMSAGSFAVMGLQLGYAAITSRLLAPSVFGAYAVALAGMGVLSMLNGSSMGQAAARRDHDSVQLDRALVTLALLMGTAVAALAMALAGPWGNLWGIPESATTTRVLALGSPFAAVAGVLAGILRRHGRTTVVASRTALGQVVGMAVGLAVVLGTRSAWSLAVASVIGWVVAAILIGAAVPTDRLRPVRPTSEAVAEVVYSAKSAGMDLLRMLTYQLPSWSISRFAGADALGAYNRAITLITIPLETLQRSFEYALFPELRPNGPVFRSPRAFTDILVLVTWPAVVLGGIGFFAAPPALGLILGAGWEDASAMAGLAVLLGVVPMILVPLGSALEALGWFKVATVGWLLSAIAIGVGAFTTFQTSTATPAILGYLAALVLPIGVYVFVLARRGLLLVRGLVAGTWRLLLVQAGLSAALVAGLSLVPSGYVAQLALTLGVGIVELVLLWALRGRTTFGRLAHERGLPGFRSRNRSTSISRS